ncbi:MAG TPA: type VI secretion system tip protein TssI/VgrG [Chthoniobacterales bacterium]
MASFSQSNRPLQVTTPLGDNVLLATGFRGREELSGLFSFELDLIAENATQVDFSKLVGSELSLKAATPGDGGEERWRYLSGICACFSQGDRGERFTSFYAEIVPRVWLLTQQAQSRIFQQKSVPDILKEVFGGFDCDYELHGHYEPREYCVQYRESDFDFANRLMQEEGIYWFFIHNPGGHKMIVADSAQSHLDVPGLTKARYGMAEGGARKADHVFEWRKTQTIRPSRYSVWDHSFQQPKQNLEAKAKIMPSVQAGSVEHTLNGKVNAPLEVYEYPGGYAVRFDGVNPNGNDQPERLQKIFDDNERTAKLRIQAEAAESLKIVGSSSCINFTAGYKFELDRHFDADGEYVLASVTHDAAMPDAYTSNPGGTDLSYSNTFTCIPLQLPFRPKRKTPKPFVQGVQTALVTGPPGEEIFTDKYGRVKVQFYWDRQGKKDANSSCWLRVGQSWAGKGWGSTQIPRIGQEVIVAFVEGNPDEPLIVGCVYNAETMPPYELPGKKVVSGLKSNTHKGKGYNEMSMDDTAGKENITIHAQYDMNTKVEHDLSETIKNNATIEISEGTYKHDVKTGTANYHVQGALTEKYDATQDTTVKGNLTIKSTGGAIVVSADSQHIYIHAATSIQLHTGASKLWMASDGNIELSGTQVAITGTAKVYVKGGQVVSEADTTHEISGAAVKSAGSVTNTVQGGVVMLNP